MISIAIPAYEMGGHGVEVLDRLFTSLAMQTYKHFEVVVADHSVDDSILQYCISASMYLRVKHFRNTENRGSPSANTQFAIEHSSGDIVKILCQDDYLYNEHSLEIISNAFTSEVSWLATGYIHSQMGSPYFKSEHFPSWNDRIYVNNTIGTPSCIAFLRGKEVPFDTTLKYYYDAVFYKDMFNKCGTPKMINDITVVNYLWDKSITSTISQELIEQERQYVINKYEGNNAV